MGRRPADLSGRKFGMLTAKYATEKRDKRGSVYWHCVCDCGNEVDVTAAGRCAWELSELRLFTEEKSSWNCTEKTSRRRNMCWSTRKEKKQKRQHEWFPGRFSSWRIVIGIVWISGSRESAIMLVFLIIMTKRCRQDLRRKIWFTIGFIQKWKEWNEKEKEDPEWGKEHPLVFDVKKEDGEIRVRVWECLLNKQKQRSIVKKDLIFTLNIPKIRCEMTWNMRWKWVISTQFAGGWGTHSGRDKADVAEWEKWWRRW